MSRGRAYRNFATLVFSVAVIVATVLVGIILRNPATHANLESAEYYDRTQLALLGEHYDYAGYGDMSEIDPSADPHVAGRLLYVRAGCIGCHGEFGQGGVIGTELWDLVAEDPGDVLRDVRDGPRGMPAYPEAVLSSDAIGLIVAFLEAAPRDAATAGVTTTTTTRPAPTTTTTSGVSSATTVPGVATTSTMAAVVERTLDAPVVTGLVADGDPGDWEGVPELALTLEPIIDKDAPPRDAWVRVAHDDTHLYVLFAVEDDFNWTDVDPHFAGAPAVMWPIDSAAGPHMGGEDLSGHPPLGMVDIWYWRLDCPLGIASGGAVSGPGSGEPGNDAACNLDDEWASDPETHDDDTGPGAENSLLGAFGHTNPVEDGAGIWYFEFRRPLQTGDPLDAQFTIGTDTLLSLAYWDPDAGQNGWGRQDHVQSANGGWIRIRLLG